MFTLNEVDLQLGADVWGPKRGKLCTFEPHYHKLEQIVSLDNSELKNLFIYISLINPKYIN